MRNSKMGIPAFVRAVVVMVAAAAAAFTVAQEGPFTVESLHGTYVAFLGNDVRADEPFPNRAQSVMVHYAGDGSYHGVFLYSNQPGDPDAEGNPTRSLDIDPRDPETHLHFTGTVEVTPQGYFVLDSPFGKFHGSPRRIEAIGGTLTLVEYWLVFARPAVNTGGAAISEHVRLMDEDILPEAPAETEDGMGE